MRESQHESTVEISKTQKAAKLYYSGWDWPIPNDLDLGWIHMHTPSIKNVSQILNLGHAKSALLQIGTQLVLPQCLEDLSDVMKVLFPSLAEDQNVIQVHHYEWVGEWPQDVVHHPHEGFGSIRQPERHDMPFEKAHVGF